MAPNRIVSAHVDRTRVELRLPPAERPLDVPQLMVDAVDFPAVHPRLRGDQEVVSRQLPVLGQPFLVSGDADLRPFQFLARRGVGHADPDPLRVPPSDRLLDPRLRRLRRCLPVLARDLDALLLPQGRAERRDPLLGPKELHGLAVLALAFVGIGVGDRLVAVGEVPLGVPDVRPSVRAEPPLQVLLRHHLRRLREDVPVVLPASADVLGAVEAFVRHLHDLSLAPSVLPRLPPGPGEMRLLALVPREDLPLVRDEVRVEHQGHGDDRVRAVLLRRPLALDPGLAVDLEVVVRAVEVDPAPVSPELLVHRKVEDVDHILAGLAEKAEPLVPLSHGRLPRGIPEPRREHLGEGLPLRARVHGSRLGEREEDVREAEADPAPEGKEVDPLLCAQVVRHALEEEVSVVDRARAVADLLRGRLLPFPFPGGSGLLEPLLAFRGALPVLPELREEAELPHRLVLVLLLL